MTLTSILQAHKGEYHRVVPFDSLRDKLYSFDFTEANTGLSPDTIADTDAFSVYINQTLRENKARYGFGGYGEHRTLYARSRHFDMPQGSESPAAVSGTGSSGIGNSGSSGTGGSGSGTGITGIGSSSTGDSGFADRAEPRRVHLGIDIWGPVGTPVIAPLDGIVHSFAFNNRDGDYGATIILTHQLDGIAFHTLYGHLSLNSLKNLHDGKTIHRGDVIAEFGMRFENGNWPPHLHFQIISDMQDWKGDYPGVCRYSEKAEWLGGCPDPDLILEMH